jgi:outer membrane protein OmpA-like peptidoglycan-associated protein
MDDLEGTVVFPGPVTTGVDAEFETGWVGVGSIGYAWDNWRLEFELGYRDQTTDSISFGGVTGTAFADVSHFSQMINLIWDIPLSDNFSMSLGAGVGGAFLNYEVGGTTGLGSFFVGDDDDYVFAYQGIAGLAYDISDRMEIFAEYRFFGVDEFSAAGGSVQPVGAPVFIGDDDIENHAALFGVRYHFTEPPPPAPAPAPEPGPAPAPPKTYIVFFDFNKSNLTSEAQGVVAEAAETFRQTGTVRLKVTGHTDTVGSQGYNQALSERRAASVAAELVRLGVPQDAITTEGRSFNDPMVPTGPGVREPQNRRAVIDLGA